MKYVLTLITLLILLTPSLFAVDPPHWTSFNTTEDCTTSCHTGHSSLGSALTSSASNVNLCQACHNDSGAASNRPINTTDMASASTDTGFHHAFGVDADLNYDTVLPTDSAMVLRIMGGNIVCSTCHDQHDAGDSTLNADSYISPTEQVTALGSTGGVTSGGTYTGAGGAWYLIKISLAGNNTNAQYEYSKDNGTTWFGAKIVTNGTLDNGATVNFGAGNYTLDEQWQFYAAWPFLRAALDTGTNAAGTKFCRDCHTNWVMTHTDTRTYDGTAKSHPVGITLDANGFGYDRAAPLDGNGNPQGGAEDGIASNNLKLDSGGLVQCYTCHGVHYADGNTLTEGRP